MPKLHGFIEYRFVIPGYTHPMGYKTEVVDDAPHIALVAEGQKEYAEMMRRRAEACRQRMHSQHPFLCGGVEVPGCYFNNGERRYNCSVLAQRAIDATRTDERSVLVKIHIPV